MGSKVALNPRCPLGSLAAMRWAVDAGSESQARRAEVWSIEITHATTPVDNSLFAGNPEGEKGAGSQLSADYHALSGLQSPPELGCDSRR